jgi:hypothetical protein
MTTVQGISQSSLTNSKNKTSNVVIGASNNSPGDKNRWNYVDKSFIRVSQQKFEKVEHDTGNKPRDEQRFNMVINKPWNTLFWQDELPVALQQNGQQIRFYVERYCLSHILHSFLPDNYYEMMVGLTTEEQKNSYMIRQLQWAAKSFARVCKTIASSVIVVKSLRHPRHIDRSLVYFVEAMQCQPNYWVATSDVLKLGRNSKIQGEENEEVMSFVKQ